ncbi:MAG TPA: hypothetical protein VIH12_07940 [Solibacillus sp.]
MNYEVVLYDGSQGIQYADVENVAEVFYSEDMIFFNNEKGQNLLIVPKSKLIYVKLVTE